MPRVRREKVSLSLDGALLRRLERCAARNGQSNRSQAVEEAIAFWIREQSRHQIEDEVERYYRSLTPRELREDKEWSGLGDEQIRSWKR